MSNLVVAAIPDENDRVWKISSEKIPHMTLLFLGDMDNVQNLDEIMLFVEHAANTSLRRFYLPVDRRDELGADQADVLFFKKGRYDYKVIHDFRASLLQDNNIRKAYDSSTQFDGPWQPHLTLGYPAAPAKPIPDDQIGTIYDVSFNKIAVWTGDFEGVDFLLKDFGEEFEALSTVPMDVAMSEIEHYGVKGMRWGQRNAQGGSNTSGVGETKREGIQRFLDPTGHDVSTDVVKTAVGVIVPIVAPLTWPAQIRLVRGGARGVKAKALDSQEKKFAKKAMSPKNFVAIHNGALSKINRDIDGINKKYPQPKKDATTQKRYDSEVLKSMQNGYRQSANSIGNKAGTQHLDVEFVNDGQDFKIHARQGAPTPQPKRVKHAAEDVVNEEITVEITGKIKRDANGYIVGFVFDHLEEKSVAHTIELGTEFLEHYGVKGMRWGTRRASAVTTQQHIDTGLFRRRTQVVAKGGASAPAHTDAVKAATHKQVIKKSGTDALSTQELRDLANRLQVEGQVKILMSSKGKQFVAKELESEGKQALKKGAKRAIKKGAKKGTRVATVAALL